MWEHAVNHRNAEMEESRFPLIIPDNLAFMTNITRTIRKYTLFRGTYVGMDWSPLGLVCCTYIWESFPSCLCPFA